MMGHIFGDEGPHLRCSIVSIPAMLDHFHSEEIYVPETSSARKPADKSNIVDVTPRL
jgi:hypothetical protein